MRLFRLILLGLLSYVVAIIVLFPAAPAVDKIRPQLGPVALEGVHGKLFKGEIDTVRSTDDILPLEFENVGWTLAPQALLKGRAGATVRFEGYGGSGQGMVAQGWDGTLAVTDFNFDAKAKALEPLLPVPVASFSGDLNVAIERLTLLNNILSEMNGSLTWSNALLETPIPTRLGTVNVVVSPQGGQVHLVTLTAVGGDVTMDGSITLAQNGDFAADVLLSPTSTASSDVLNGLRQMGRPDNRGRVRLQRRGNLNRLM